MLALRLIAEGRTELVEMETPPAPPAGQVKVQMKTVALNHIDVWGLRGMAFAKRKLPLTVAVEGAGVVVEVGAGVTSHKVGDRVALYAGVTCGHCKRCLRGQENLCENIAGIMGFHIDGLAAQYVNLDPRQAIHIPDGVNDVDAACATTTFGTVEHMLFENARLEPGETILIQAGGSGIGTTAIRMAKKAGAYIFTTVGSDEKIDKVKALGADVAINYNKDRFESIVRRQTDKKGVDVVFEHVGPDTWAKSLFCLKRGGRLVTCGSTTGVSAETNLFALFQNQIRIFGSFGANFGNIRSGLAKMADKSVLPVIDSEIELGDIGTALRRMQSRDLFGKIVAHVPG
ncbi:NADPH:quinone oxidoreductase [Oleomonas cavernae]|uniref:NADPH:quinone oxidoreductase n=1 Tax=Oleomonas cavernae TaxID=2320859 RepID=A0A418VTM2_9PROT|nr:zinc-binding dehydrogenase [Oleomonas cavernae]RJF80474.1 NADPH:quinone oxidoreductase [Oleomonas cavernae]